MIQYKSDTQLVRINEVKAMTGISRSYIYDLMKIGKFPPKVKIASKCVAWVKSEIIAWIDVRVAESALARKSPLV